MMLSDNDIAKMRKTQMDNLPEVVYIQRLTNLPDGTGGISQSWATVAATSGRIGIPSARDIEQGGRLAENAQFVITLPHDAPAVSNDELQISGVNYQIIGFLARSGKTALRVLCKRKG